MYLASRIDNLSRVVLILILDHLAEGILDSRVVTVDKVSVDELHRHTRLACSFGSVCSVCWHLHVKLAQAALDNHVPTALLPTMATFLCFGGGAILLLGLVEGREEAERLARFEGWSSQSTAER
jgi:hypothetical protein